MAAEPVGNGHAVRLHTYNVPSEVLNLTSWQQQLYRQLLKREEQPKARARIGDESNANDMYTYASAAIHTQLPSLMAPERAARLEPDAQVLFFLPLAPWHLCSAANMAVTDLRTAREKMSSLVNSVKFNSRIIMRNAQRWPRSASFNKTRTHTCPAYDRALAWVFEQPSWLAAPDRHLWVFEFPHYCRAALRTELKAVGRAVSLQAKMALGILIAQEDRLRDWRQQRDRRRLFLVPFWGPSYFELDGEAGLSNKSVLMAESSGDGIECHRFDTFESVVAPTLEELPHERSRHRFLCEDEVMRHAADVRTAARYATNQLSGGVVLISADQRSRALHHAGRMLSRKAALYKKARTAPRRLMYLPRPS